MTEKPSKFSIQRLHSSSIRKLSSVSSQRPSTASNESPKKSFNDFAVIHDEKEKEKEKASTLRKRSVSNPASVGSGTNNNAKGRPEAVDNITGPVKEGVNIWDQIGEPDHSGWMRKKGDRYNSWKMRYFILKGPHLYFMKNNNKSVSYIPLVLLIG